MRSAAVARTTRRSSPLESRPSDVPDLFVFTTHSDPNLREALAEIFGLLGDARAVPSLRELTRDQERPGIRARVTGVAAHQQAQWILEHAW